MSSTSISKLGHLQWMKLYVKRSKSVERPLFEEKVIQTGEEISHSKYDDMRCICRQFKQLQRMPLKTKTLVTTHIYNISQTISDRSVKIWLCFLPLQDMHTRQLQKNIRVSPVWRISRWIIQIQFQQRCLFTRA